MKLFVGLGNNGGDYARNRHNIGFMAVDRIAAAHGFGPWRRKHRGEIVEGRLGDERVLLLKPHTMMNLSGESVGEAARFLKIAPEDIVVFQDEIDLAPAKVRVKRGGGHAGHNGLRSLHAHIGPDYARVRIGVGHPGHKDRVAGYVLHDFAKADAEWVEPLLDGCAEGAPALAAGDDAGFLNAIQRRLAPPKPKAARPVAEAPPAPEAAPEAAPGAASGAEKRSSPFAGLLDRFRR